MADLQTTYLGLTLNNPVVASSSRLTDSVAGVRRLAEAGAGAVVLKSLFEEQVDAERGAERIDGETSPHPEAEEYLSRMGKYLGPRDYLDLIRDAAGAVDIPVIASVNCVTDRWWSEYARQIEAAGADALELNVAIMPRGEEESSDDVDRRTAAVVSRVREEVTIPIAVKLGPYYSSLPAVVGALQRIGVNGLVLFNRFYQVDIDIENLMVRPAYRYSSRHEMYPTLRWISILRDRFFGDLSASTGVNSAEDAVKLLLVGADTVQVCSALYRNGPDHIGTLVEGIDEWASGKGFASVDAFRGRLRRTAIEDPEAYERFQYIQALTGVW